jgi:hypothetical protein
VPLRVRGHRRAGVLLAGLPDAAGAVGDGPVKTKDCTPACWAVVDCAVCGKRKHPRGRDPGMYAANGYCAYECRGHNLPPQAGHLWPNEADDEADE